MPKSVVELLVCWQGQFGRHRNGHIWTIIPHCRMWCIWRERNRRSFEDTEHFMPDLKFFFFWTLLDWLTALRNLSFFSIVDLLDLCNFCNWLFHPGIIPVYLGDSWYIYFYYLSKRKKKKHQTIFKTPSKSCQEPSLSAEFLKILPQNRKIWIFFVHIVLCFSWYQ